MKYENYYENYNDYIKAVVNECDRIRKDFNHLADRYSFRLAFRMCLSPKEAVVEANRYA